MQKRFECLFRRAVDQVADGGERVEKKVWIDL